MTVNILQINMCEMSYQMYKVNERLNYHLKITKAVLD